MIKVGNATSVQIPIVFYASPALTAAAHVAAVQSGLSINEWFEHRVAMVIGAHDAVSDDDSAAPWPLACADLFVEVANNAPETLSGKWQLLYERIKLDKELWHWPTSTPEEIEDGLLPSEPYVSKARLRAAWPRLCAATFCM